MYGQCACIVMAFHKPRCRRPATKRCTECFELMCSGCAKNHHVHYAFENLPKEK